MRLTRKLLLRMFGRPQGRLGRLGGRIMARLNRDVAVWVVGLLDLRPNDRVLEVGFGPGVAIELLASLLPAGRVSGVDASPEMVEQATERSRRAIRAGRVDLRLGTAENLPFADASFDKSLAINSMQVWPDVSSGIREIMRVTKPGGKVALGFTPYSGQSEESLRESLRAAGLVGAQVISSDKGFCAIATN
jgi:ubiquinone/menaquinone biosynthesis C-methylase UbiE